MANDLTKDILYIDTAADIFTATKLLGSIVWSNMTSGDELLISNADGKVLYDVKASVNNDYFEFDFAGLSSTLTVTTIDGGLLMYYPYVG